MSAVSAEDFSPVIRHLLSLHEIGQLLDEELAEPEKQELIEAEQICRKFMAWNMDEDDECSTAGVKKKLAEVLGRSKQGMPLIVD